MNTKHLSPFQHQNLEIMECCHHLDKYSNEELEIFYSGPDKILK